MADTRRANPAYQSQVDEMILEYLLHNAIRSQLRLLRSQISESHHGRVLDGGFFEVAATASRILQMFDCFIRLFKHHHPNHSFSELHDFNLKLLEFIILFAVHHQAQSDLPQQQISAESLDSVERNYRIHLQHRRTWLRKHRKYASENESQGQDFPDLTNSSWNSIIAQSKPSIKDTDASRPGPSLASLIPIFLSLSATAAEWRGESVHKKWMELAGEFMLQGALEQLRLAGGDEKIGTKDPDQQPRRGQDIIYEAFAYGYVPLDSDDDDDDAAAAIASHDEDTVMTNTDSPSQSPTTTQADHDFTSSETEQQLVAMFSVDVEEEGSGGPSSAELPDWTDTRVRFVNQFSQPSPATVVDHLTAAHPYHHFAAEIHRFIHSLWRLVGNGNDNGLPLLVQIERGHLRGVDGEEFRRTLERAGITQIT